MASVTVDTLRAEEYDKLKAIDDGFCPDPKNSVTVVIKHGEEIVGRAFLVAPTHLEGPWIRPDLRGRLLGKKLMDAVEQEAKKHGITKMFAYAVDEQLAGYLERLGYTKQPWTVWTKEV